MRTNTIWTFENRTLLYRTLVKRFGPYESWELKAYPKQDKESKKEYDKFCASFAVVVGANSDDAVKNQIAWAITTQDVTNGNTLCLWQNKVIAYETGFIPRNLIPCETLVRYDKSEEPEKSS